MSQIRQVMPQGVRALYPNGGSAAGGAERESEAAQRTLDITRDGRIVTVFGATGFLGRRVVRHLLERGFQVRAASRHPEAVTGPGPEAAAAEPVFADIHDPSSLAAALAGAEATVNAVSLYVERGSETFRAVHVEAAGRLARAAAQAGLGRLAHVSGIGADATSASPYIRCRGEGERAVAQAFPGAILVRPAVMFAADDAFLNTLVGLMKRLPVYPMFGQGLTRLQPAHADDVAEAIARALEPARAGPIQL